MTGVSKPTALEELADLSGLRSMLQIAEITVSLHEGVDRGEASLDKLKEITTSCRKALNEWTQDSHRAANSSSEFLHPLESRAQAALLLKDLERIEANDLPS